MHHTWIKDSPFTIARDKIKYLGINIGKRTESLYNLNFTPLFDKMVKIENVGSPPPLITGQDTPV